VAAATNNINKSAPAKASAAKNPTSAGKK